MYLHTAEGNPRIYIYTKIIVLLRPRELESMNISVFIVSKEHMNVENNT
jgi:hypothetical protein